MRSPNLPAAPLWSRAVGAAARSAAGPALAVLCALGSAVPTVAQRAPERSHLSEGGGLAKRAAAASDRRLDLAAAMPGGQQVYLEIDRPDGRLERWMGLLPPKIRALVIADWAPLISAIEGLEAPRVAIGITTQGLFREAGVTVLIEGADPVRVRTLLQTLAGEEDPTMGLPAIGRVGESFVVAASSFARLSKARDVLSGKARPFLEQRRFRASGFAALRAPIRGFIDARAIVPAGARQLFLRQEEALAPLILGGALATIARMQEALFTLQDDEGALRLELVSDGGLIDSRFAFLAPRGAAGDGAAPGATAASSPRAQRRLSWLGPPPIARLSFTRDLEAYWAAREKLVKASALGDFTAVTSQSAIFLGALPFEELLASLGPVVDVVVAPVVEAPGRKGVGVVLALPLKDREVGAELRIAAQMLVAAANFERSMNGEPRFGMRTERHAGHEVFVAALRPSVQSGEADPLAFLQPSLVHGEHHLLIASHPSLIAHLLAAEASEAYEALQTTEHLVLDAPALAKAAREFRGLLIGQALLGGAGSFAKAQAWFERGLAAVEGFEGLTLSHAISEREDRLMITLRSTQGGR